MRKHRITAAALAAAVMMSSVLGSFAAAAAPGPGETQSTEAAVTEAAPQTTPTESTTPAESTASAESAVAETVPETAVPETAPAGTNSGAQAPGEGAQTAPAASNNAYQYQPYTPAGGPGMEIGPGVSGGSTTPGGEANGTGTSSDGVELVDPSGNVSTGSTGLNHTDLSLTRDAGKVEADDILHLAPFVHAQLLKTDGQLTGGFTSNMEAFSTEGDGLAGLKMRLENGVGDIFYRVYTAEHGWSQWAMNDMITSYAGDGAKVQAVQLRIKGYTRNLYDLYYQATLNDGTVLDWAYNGQTAGTMGTDKYIQKLQLALWKKDVPYWQPTANHMLAENYEGLITEADGSVRYQTFNGAVYTGWAYDLNNNKYYFKDGEPLKGWQYLDGYKYYFDETSGKVVTDLEPIMGLPGDYQIKVNKAMKTLTIYAKDGDNGYIIPFKVFLVTVGPDTPIGSYKTYAKYRWKFMHDNIYCQYLSRFYNGFILHSIIYKDKPDSYHLDAATYNYLGKTSSDGCIRMVSGDAAWIYNNCKTGTTVTIYNDEWVMGPYDRPAIEQAIPMDQTWDPTDPELQGKV